MKNFKLSIITMLCFCFMFMNCVHCLACDTDLYYDEEQHLYYEDFLETSCKGSRYKSADTICDKLLVRYDGLESKIKEMEKVIKKDIIGEDSTIEKLEKAGILTTVIALLGIGMFSAPVATCLTTIFFGGLGAWFAYNKDKICDCTPKENTNNEGFLETVRKFLFGIKRSDLRISKVKESYQELLDEFHKQVKDKKFEGNNVLAMCMDSTDINDIKTKVKFQKTNLNIGDYPNKTEDYFKNF